MLSYHCDDTSHDCYISTTVQNQPEKKCWCEFSRPLKQQTLTYEEAYKTVLLAGDFRLFLLAQMLTVLEKKVYACPA